MMSLGSASTCHVLGQRIAKVAIASRMNEAMATQLQSPGLLTWSACPPRNDVAMAAPDSSSPARPLRLSRAPAGPTRRLFLLRTRAHRLRHPSALSPAPLLNDDTAIGRNWHRAYAARAAAPLPSQRSAAARQSRPAR